MFEVTVRSKVLAVKHPAREFMMENYDRRYQIFISSTFKDLEDERKKAIEVVFERGHIPIALERFSAANKSDLEVIKKVMAECQVYILILGHRYGSIPDGHEKSYTEIEYELAKENGLLILPFILREEEIYKRRKDKLDENNVRDKAELLNLGKLEKFHKSLRHFLQPWGEEDEFKCLVLKALDDNLKECKKPGFIREPEESVNKIVSASQNEFILDIIGQLKNFEKLYERCLEHPEKKRALAKFFRERYLGKITRNNVSLFFESGSTVTYVASELAEHLRDKVQINDEGISNIHINTNNVLAYLQLWLKARIPCATFPWSPPLEETYGAFYGRLQGLPEQSPDYTMPPLDEEAKEEIQKLLSAPFTLTWRHPALLLGAASGLQISKEHNVKIDDALDTHSRNVLRSQIDNCFGPHVGSYRNKVFKRFMYATGLPLMIFMTGDKIDCEIDSKKCHFILDSESTWEEFYKNYPVAFCIGCSQENKRKYVEMFQWLDFKIWEGTGSLPISAFIARNQAFISEFERASPQPRITQVRKMETA
ncbi:MAG TPA: DUF4062 domain-containing protein [Pyrinomonadaceae bacterium]|nr:DUF4062 domain-containing protein [Pyrinomonadaceae bacterium]